MKAIKCDRCGKFSVTVLQRHVYDKNSTYSTGLTRNVFGISLARWLSWDDGVPKEVIDLCSDCCESLSRWLSRSYREDDL